MKRHARLLTAVVVGALFAVAVAVPVLAGALRGDPAISGTAHLYEQRATAGSGYGDWKARGPATARVTFDTRVAPWALRFTLTGTHLRRNTPYALMNPLYQGYDPDQDLAFAVVRVLAQGTSNRAGLLTLRGTAGGSAASLPLYDEATFSNVTILGERVARLASGADLWLVPISDDLYWPYDEMQLSPATDADGNTFAIFNLPSYPAPEPGFVYAALGLPSAGAAVLSYPLPPGWGSSAARSAASDAALPRNSRAARPAAVSPPAGRRPSPAPGPASARRTG